MTVTSDTELNLEISLTIATARTFLLLCVYRGLLVLTLHTVLLHALDLGIN